MAAKKTATKKASTKRTTKKKRASKGNGKGTNAAAQAAADNVVDINTKKSKATPAEKARAQQYLDMPGVQPVRDKKLSELADELYNHRTLRLQHGRQEKDFENKLLAEMQGKEMEVYVDTDLGLRVDVVASEYKVKVKKFDPDEE